MTTDQAAGTVLEFTLEIAGIQESVACRGRRHGYAASAVSSATKTTTPLRDVPQAVSVVSSALIADQRMTSMADVARYMPGVGIAQGEGNRDTPILRGNSTTADFFVDGVRDDVQYFRDLYNVERVEALKGPNAMIFGRGGVGGVINRVTRQADWGQSREASLQVGSWDNKRVTADVGRGRERGGCRCGPPALYEDSDSYRDGVDLERYGVNPTAVVRASARTRRCAAATSTSTTNASPTAASRRSTAGRSRPTRHLLRRSGAEPQPHATVQPAVGAARAPLRHAASRCATGISYGDYDKFYQNVFPGAVNAARDHGRPSRPTTTRRTRQNLFNQTDVIAAAQTGRFGHTLLVGSRVRPAGDRQLPQHRLLHDARPERHDRSTRRSSAPTISLPLDVPPERDRRRQPRRRDRRRGLRAGSDRAHRHAPGGRRPAVRQLRGRLTTTAPRPTSAATTASCRRARADLQADRAAVALRQLQPVLPAAGRRAAVVAVAHQPGARSRGVPQLRGRRQVGRPAGALRSPPRSTGSIAATSSSRTRTIRRVSLLVDAQRTKGLELGVNGNVTRAWSVAGGYAYQDGEITRSISATAQAGASLAQLPKHSLSLWNRYDVYGRLAAGLGRDLARRGVHVDRQPGRPAELDARRRRRLLHVTPAAARAGQRREPVRRELLPDRAQQHQHHAGLIARCTVGAHVALLRSGVVHSELVG